MEMAVSASEIRGLLREMDASKARWRHLKVSNPTEYVERIMADCPVLARDFDGIFVLHIKDELDAKIFTALDLRADVDSGRRTAEDAEVEMGKRLAEEYVDPVVARLERRPPVAPPHKVTYEEYMAGRRK